MSAEMQTRSDWTAAGEAGLADVVALRRAIHADPEIGLHCPRTTEKLKQALAGLPLEIHEGSSTTGFMAVLRGGGDNGRTVLLRGDMDALPMEEENEIDFASKNAGIMHACGHDAHSAMLVGAARALCEKRDELPGTVVFMFQPGEEGHHGARFMIEDGLLEQVAPDAGFALHVYPNLPAGTFVSRPGPLMASTDTLYATIRGRGGHAAMPHDSIDPIPVACEIVTALQTWVARRVPVSDPAVLTITKIEAGSTHNVIPGQAKLLGTLRTLSEETREKARAAFRRIVSEIAAAHECEGEAEIEAGYPVTVNDDRATAMVRDIAESMGGDQPWMTMPAPMMGAEDFSYVLREIPGAMSFIGAAPAGSDPATNPALHNTRMMIDEDVLARGVAMHCAVAERYLERGFD
ncbi:M20 metallopeptidase family protein [Stakelama saccharophila]|uniref:M20 family metallopeptidase n=1 Tax=Stakelama saccharophila TaxID=3075605 RepID=A0ABZ0BBG1_9SPHN|nr:M20 family metallopeptidase [Stakelama sp. W311]WNO54619.1 M20 family metallopeptidase [Stakelama sp. W311]